MLCCVGGSASRMGDLLGPPPNPAPQSASRMGDLLGPPPASRMGDLLGPPPDPAPRITRARGGRWSATYEFSGHFREGGLEGGVDWVAVVGWCAWSWRAALGGEARTLIAQ